MHGASRRSCSRRSTCRRRRAFPAPGARTSTPSERLATFEATAAPVSAPDGPITEPLSLSFYQIDDYLTCPLKYKYAHVLRVPLAPHHAIIYGAALHKAVQLFHNRQAKGQVMTEAELEEAFEAAWSNEGFVSRDHEEARLEAGRAALRRFRAAQLEPGAVIPTYVEREFSFTLGGDRVRGRWDRVDIEPAKDGGARAAGRRRAGAERGRRLADARDARPRAGDDHGLQVVRRARPGEGAAARPRLAPAPDLRDGLRGDDRSPARRGRPPLPRVGARRPGGRWIRSGWPRRATGSPSGRRDAGAGLRADARLPRLHLLRVPRHLPVERRALIASATRRAAPRIGHSPDSTARRPSGIVRDPPSPAVRTGERIDHGPPRLEVPALGAEPWFEGPRLDGHGVTATGWPTSGSSRPPPSSGSWSGSS